MARYCECCFRMVKCKLITAVAFLCASAMLASMITAQFDGKHIFGVSGEQVNGECLCPIFPSNPATVFGFHAFGVIVTQACVAPPPHNQAPTFGSLTSSTTITKSQLLSQSYRPVNVRLPTPRSAVTRKQLQRTGFNPAPDMVP